MPEHTARNQGDLCTLLRREPRGLASRPEGCASRSPTGSNRTTAVAGSLLLFPTCHQHIRTGAVMMLGNRSHDALQASSTDTAGATRRVEQEGTSAHDMASCLLCRA